MLFKMILLLYLSKRVRNFLFFWAAITGRAGRFWLSGPRTRILYSKSRMDQTPCSFGYSINRVRVLQYERVFPPVFRQG
jgi:hypothetical protein